MQDWHCTAAGHSPCSGLDKPVNPSDNHMHLHSAVFVAWVTCDAAALDVLLKGSVENVMSDCSGNSAGLFLFQQLFSVRTFLKHGERTISCYAFRSEYSKLRKNNVFNIVLSLEIQISEVAL